MNTRNTMASSYHSQVRSTQNKGVTILLLGLWTLVSFLHAGARPEIFQGRGGFVELGHLDKHFVRNTRKKGPARENLWNFFSYYQKYILNEKFNPKMDTIWDLFLKIFPLFSIFNTSSNLVAHLYWFHHSR